MELWRVSSVASDRDNAASYSDLGDDLLQYPQRDLAEDEGIRFVSGDGPQIRPGPGEAIELGGYDPRGLIIQTQARLCAGRQFDSVGLEGRPCVRDGRDVDDEPAQLPLGRQHDHAGAIFRALLTTGSSLILPEIGIADH